jgi:hypothetical protein
MKKVVVAGLLAGLIVVARPALTDGVGVATEFSYPTQWSQPQIGPNGAVVPPVPTRFRTREIGVGFSPRPVGGPAAPTSQPLQPPQIVVAADKGDLPAVRALLEKGAAVDAPTGDGSTALMAAAARGHLPLVELLLDKGADVNEVNSAGKTALIYAAGNGHAKVVETLLAHKADRKVLDMAGLTALDYAVTNRHAEVVTLLKAAGR